MASILNFLLFLSDTISLSLEYQAYSFKGVTVTSWQYFSMVQKKTMKCF